MRKNRFNILNLEEFDDSQVEGQVEESTTPVADAIEDEDNVVELNNEISAFEEYCEENNNAIDAASELQDQVDAQEEIMENNPEQVTEQTVEVAQEQFYQTINKISSLRFYGTSGTISHELSAGTPLERLKVSCEGVKDFINAVIEKIKAFFKMIKNWLVKILQKFGILKKNEEKTAKLLKNLPAKIESSKILKAVEEFKQNTSTDISETIGFYGSNNKLSDTLYLLFDSKYIDTFSKKLKDVQALLSLLKSVTDDIKNITNFDSEDAADEFVDKHCTEKLIKIMKEYEDREELKYLPESIINEIKNTDNGTLIKFTHSEVDAISFNDKKGKIDKYNYKFDLKLNDKFVASLIEEVVKNKEKYEKDVLVNKSKSEELYRKHFANLENHYSKVTIDLEKNLKALNDRLNGDSVIPNKHVVGVTIFIKVIENTLVEIMKGSAFSIFDNVNTTLRVVKLVSDIANKSDVESTDESKK